MFLLINPTKYVLSKSKIAFLRAVDYFNEHLSHQSEIFNSKIHIRRALRVNPGAYCLNKIIFFFFKSSKLTISIKKFSKKG